MDSAEGGALEGPELWGEAPSTSAHSLWEGGGC